MVSPESFQFAVWLQRLALWSGNSCGCQDSDHAGLFEGHCIQSGGLNYRCHNYLPPDSSQTDPKMQQRLQGCTWNNPRRALRDGVCVEGESDLVGRLLPANRQAHRHRCRRRLLGDAHIISRETQGELCAEAAPGCASVALTGYSIVDVLGGW